MKKTGFTLIEILIVVGLMGILVTVVIVAVYGSRERARLASLYAYSGQIYRTLVNNCIGVWDFNTVTSGTTPDTCRASQTGTISGATVVDGINNTKGLNFDGSNDSVRFTGVPAIGNTYTLEAWVYPHTLAGLDIFLGKQNAGGSGTFPRLARQGTAYRVFLSSSVSIGSPNNSVLLNRWQHIVATHDGTTARLYVDAKIVAQQTVTSPNFVAANWDVGRGYNSNSNAFDGWIDNVRIYSEPVPTQ
ncbi:MAG: LamG-like jellyroll fold domain-containing protein [Candidatus Andersenbacteria bacterium]